MDREPPLYPNRVAELRRRWDATATQEEVADLLGVAPNTLSRLENGNIALTYARVRQLSDLFRCHPGELFEPLPAPSPRLAEAVAIAERLDDADFDYWLSMGRRLLRP